MVPDTAHPRVHPGYFGTTCAFDACFGGLLPPVVAASGRFVTNAGDDYPPGMQCGFFVTLPGRPDVGITGIRVRFDRFDIEYPEGQATTTVRGGVAL